MKINATNTKALRAHSDKINLKASGQFYTHCIGAYKIVDSAADAESKLEELGIPKNKRKGAAWTLDFTPVVPNSYRGRYVKAGLAKLERGATGWFVTHWTCDEARVVHKAGGGDVVSDGHLTLTKEQGEQAFSNLKEMFGFGVGLV